MTAQELYDRYKGRYIRYAGGQTKFWQGYVRLIGISNNELLYELPNDGVFPIKEGDRILDGSTIWDGVNKDSAKGCWVGKSCLNFNDVRGEHSSICCRCGDRYTNKSRHRAECMKPKGESK